MAFREMRPDGLHGPPPWELAAPTWPAAPQETEPAGAGVAEGQLLAGDVYYLRLYEERGRDFDATILLYRPVD